MIYNWKTGTQIKADAQATGELLEALAAQDRLTPAELVEESRPEGALLHNEFTWDDALAAKKYREIQARHIIISIESVPTEDKNIPVTRAFVRAEAGAIKKYEPIRIATSDEGKYNYLLSQARKEMAAFIRKYRNLEELDPVIRAMEASIIDISPDVEKKAN